MSTRKPKPAAAAQPAPENAAEQAPAAVTEGADIIEASAEVTPPADPPQPTHYLVAATKRRGRWRAGRFWPSEHTRVARDELDADAWEQVLADPALTVTEA